MSKRAEALWLFGAIGERLGSGDRNSSFTFLSWVSCLSADCRLGSNGGCSWYSTLTSAYYDEQVCGFYVRMQVKYNTVICQPHKRAGVQGPREQADYVHKNVFYVLFHTNVELSLLSSWEWKSVQTHTNFRAINLSKALSNFLDSTPYMFINLFNKRISFT